MKSFVKAAILGLALMAAPSMAHAEGEGAGGDAAKGESVFRKCKACHVAEETKNRVGPYLNGVIGRKAGVAEGYKYSKLNEAAGAAGLVWTEDFMFAYLEDPSKYLVEFIKANGDAADATGRSKMVYKLKDETERKDVIAYLKTFSPAQ